jgi:hypothetical protein
MRNRIFMKPIAIGDLPGRGFSCGRVNDLFDFDPKQ